MDSLKPKTKETDITGILFIILVLLVGALIINTSNSFSTQKVSTSTQAAKDKHATCYQSRPFGYSNYLPDRRNIVDMSNFDYCPSGIIPKCTNGYVRDLTSSKWGKSGIHTEKCINNCCRNVTEVSKLGSEMCKNTLQDVSAVCATSQYACPTGLIATTTKCGYISGSDLLTGRCCVASLTPMPTPTAQPIVFDHRNCGPQHLNCLEMFGDGTVDFNNIGGGGIGSQDGKHNIDTLGRRMQGVCTIPEKYANQPNSEQYAQCALRTDLGVQLDSCSKGVYAYLPSLGNNYCYASLSGSPSNTIGGEFKICLVEPQSMSGNSTCKDIANR